MTDPQMHVRVAPGVSLRAAVDGIRAVAPEQTPVVVAVGTRDQQSLILAVDQALDSHHEPATCIDAGTDGGGDYVTITVLVPSADDVQLAGQTDSDVVYVNEKTRSHLAAVASTIVGAVRETCEVAPHGTRVRVVGLQRHDRRFRGPVVRPVFAGEFTADEIDLERRNASPEDVVFAAGGARIFQREWTGKLGAIDVAEHPDLAQIASAFGKALAAQR
ncbi:MAG: hypothetical protein QM658_18340 [Gordonia sp. (in: high G+C Gram-positive bacteria)]